MGTIQSSINHLMGTAWGAIATLSVGAKKLGVFDKKKTKAPEVKAETTSGMGNIVKQGRLPRNKYAKAVSVMSANNLIDEKAASKTFSVADRIAAATSLSVIDKGGKK